MLLGSEVVSSQNPGTKAHQWVAGGSTGPPGQGQAPGPPYSYTVLLEKYRKPTETTSKTTPDTPLTRFKNLLHPP